MLCAYSARLLNRLGECSRPKGPRVSVWHTALRQAQGARSRGGPQYGKGGEGPKQSNMGSAVGGAEGRPVV